MTEDLSIVEAPWLSLPFSRCHHSSAVPQHAALCCEAGQGEQGGALFNEAMQAYQRACGLSDAADGDDVPGLLINWSRGLLSMAQQAQVRQGGSKVAVHCTRLGGLQGTSTSLQCVGSAFYQEVLLPACLPS